MSRWPGDDWPTMPPPRRMRMARAARAAMLGLAIGGTVALLLFAWLATTLTGAGS